jgi:hypothetical protein
MKARMAPGAGPFPLLCGGAGALKFCGPFEVFSVANAFTDPPAFHVFTVAEKPGPVLTRGGLGVNPHDRLHRVNVAEVVPSTVLGRRLEELRLHELLHQRPGLLFDFGLEISGHRRRGNR